MRARRPDLPIGAIAGIGLDNAAAVIAAGADGIAVISEIFLAADPAEAARRLRAVVDAARTARQPEHRP
jgi:thiamine-phosphate pyrophosphorylase